MGILPARQTTIHASNTHWRKQFIQQIARKSVFAINIVSACENKTVINKLIEYTCSMIASEGAFSTLAIGHDNTRYSKANAALIRVLSTNADACSLFSSFSSCWWLNQI